MDKATPDDLKRLYEALDARREELGMTKTEMYRKSGVSQASFAAMRQGKPGLAKPERLRRIELALELPPMSIDQILAGEQLETLPPMPPQYAQGFQSIAEAVESLNEDLRGFSERIERTLHQILDRLDK